MNSFYKLIVIGLISISSFSNADVTKQEEISKDEAQTKVLAKDKLVISQPDMEYSLFVETATRVLKEAYSRIGKTIEYELFPVERSINLANAGVTQGELARISGLQTKYPNLIKISVPIATHKISVYSKKYDFTVAGWESLRPYIFDFIFGLKLAEQKTKGMDARTVQTRYQGLRKLNEGRSDLFVGILGAECSIKKYKFNDIKRLKPHLESVMMYHYLHKRNQGLVEKLEVVLQEMKQSGEIKAIQKQAIKELLQQCKKNS